MSAERDLADYFETLVNAGITPHTAAQWMAGRFLPALKEKHQEIASTSLTPDRAAELLSMLEKEVINAKQAKKILLLMFTSEKSAAAIADEKGFKQITDPAALTAILEQVMADQPDAVANLRSGKKQAASFLIGQAMQQSRGKANPKLLADLLEDLMGAN